MLFRRAGKRKKIKKKAGKKNQLDGGVIRCISQMFAVLRRLYYKHPPSPLAFPARRCCAEPSAGDQHAKSAVGQKSINSGKPRRQRAHLDSEGTAAANTHAGTFCFFRRALVLALASRLRKGKQSPERGARTRLLAGDLLITQRDATAV